MNIFLLVAVQRQEHARLSWKPKQFDHRAFAIRCASRADHREQLRARAAEAGIRRLSILLGQSNLILPPRHAFWPSTIPCRSSAFRTQEFDNLRTACRSGIMGHASPHPTPQRQQPSRDMARLFGDVHIGTIGKRAGVPHDVQQWGWSCGFYPGCEPGQHTNGAADTFEAARKGFEEDWTRMLPMLRESAFVDWRRAQALHAWKYRMWDTGCRLPTQERSGRSRCFCGAEVDVKTVDPHIVEAHGQMRC
jgi:hypothetical protein